MSLETNTILKFNENDILDNFISEIYNNNSLKICFYNENLEIQIYYYKSNNTTQAVSSCDKILNSKKPIIVGKDSYGRTILIFTLVVTNFFEEENYIKHIIHQQFIDNKNIWYITSLKQLNYDNEFFINGLLNYNTVERLIKLLNKETLYSYKTKDTHMEVETDFINGTGNQKIRINL